MWPNPQETVDLVTYTEEILNGKLHCLCSVVICYDRWVLSQGHKNYLKDFFTFFAVGEQFLQSAYVVQLKRSHYHVKMKNIMNGEIISFNIQQNWPRFIKKTSKYDSALISWSLRSWGGNNCHDKREENVKKTIAAAIAAVIRGS